MHVCTSNLHISFPWRYSYVAVSQMALYYLSVQLGQQMIQLLDLKIEYVKDRHM